MRPIEQRGLFTVISAVAFAVVTVYLGRSVAADETVASLASRKFSYQKHVYPILKNKCSACHTDTEERPFFYHWPFVSAWAGPYVDKKIERARSRFEIFTSLTEKEPPMVLDYGRKIRRMVEQQKMPPTPYLFIHPDKRVTKEELSIISGWMSALASSTPDSSFQ